MIGIAVVVGAASGAIGGALGALLARASGFGPTGKRTLAVIPALLCTAVGHQLLTPRVEEWWADANARTPYQKYMRASEKAMRADLGHFKGLNKEAAHEAGRRLANQGLTRLSDLALIRRAELTAQGLEGVDEATCARIAHGVVEEKTGEAFLDAMGEEGAVEFATLVAAATHAEIVQSPFARPPSTEQDGIRIMSAVASHATQAEIADIAGAFKQGATDHVVCSGVRALYRHLRSVSPEDQPRLSLILAGR
ncbi:MAG TPA: hypothetical protein VMT45_13320 [Thermoanaerobaculaceae bacterium]|nr:hypothetical protein [Thermoanaerobaculaceae bacterium]